MTYEEFSNLQRVEKLENENKEIKEILIMFINHIKRDGDIYPFRFNEQDRMIEIAKKWLNLEGEPCGGCKYVNICVGIDGDNCPLLSPKEDIIQIMDEKLKEYTE